VEYGDRSNTWNKEWDRQLKRVPVSLSRRSRNINGALKQNGKEKEEGMEQMLEGHVMIFAKTRELPAAPTTQPRSPHPSSLSH
jgi:hypothetical protein